MQLAAQQDYLERFGDTLVPMGPFAARKLGLDPAQTSLKIDTYNLACAAYRFGMKGAVLLCFLSRDELAFFQRFQGGMGGIGLSLQPANRQQPVKIFGRCTLNAFTPMKGRDNVGLVAVDWKPCPPDLLEALGEYQVLLERLKTEYEERKDQVVPINAQSAKVMGYNNFATLASGGEPFKAALFGLSSARLDFLLPLQAPELAEGAELQAKLYFQKYQFSVTGKLSSIERLPTGVRRTRVSIGFSPELVEILGDYGFASRLAAKREGDGA